MQSLVSLIAKEKDLLIQSILKLHKQYRELIIYSPSRKMCCTSTGAKVQPKLMVLNKKEYHLSPDSSTMDSFVISIPPERIQPSQETITDPALATMQSDLASRNILNFHDEQVYTESNLKLMEEFQELVNKLREYNALFLYKKLRAESITLDLLPKLDVDKLVAKLNLNYGESETLKGFISWMSPAKQTAIVSHIKETPKDKSSVALPSVDDYSSSFDSSETMLDQQSSMQPKLGVVNLNQLSHARTQSGADFATAGALTKDIANNAPEMYSYFILLVFLYNL